MNAKTFLIVLVVVVVVYIAYQYNQGKQAAAVAATATASTANTTSLITATNAPPQSTIQNNAAAPGGPLTGIMLPAAQAPVSAVTGTAFFTTNTLLQ